ncbi:C-type lectin domain family 2 member G, partial [Lemmus lemmus]
NFLKRYVGYPCYWIGLYRESLQHPWKWTDDSEYNDMYVLEVDILIFIFSGKKQQGQCLSIVSTEPPVKLYCCYVVIMVLTVAVIALSVALSEKPVVLSPGSCYANCPNGWFGFGSKCFYFSDDVRNWTLSQTYCMEQGAQLARFDSLEELVSKDQELVCYLFC